MKGDWQHGSQEDADMDESWVVWRDTGRGTWEEFLEHYDGIRARKEDDNA